MNLIEPMSFVMGAIVGVIACYSVSDLVFAKETEHEEEA